MYFPTVCLLWFLSFLLKRNVICGFTFGCVTRVIKPDSSNWFYRLYSICFCVIQPFVVSIRCVYAVFRPRHSSTRNWRRFFCLYVFFLFFFLEKKKNGWHGTIISKWIILRIFGRFVFWNNVKYTIRLFLSNSYLIEYIRCQTNIDAISYSLLFLYAYSNICTSII